MSTRDRLRSAGWAFWVPAIASVIAVTLSVLSIVDPHWIETLFEASPDKGSGESEWWITAVFATAAVVALVVTRWRWRRIQPAS
jgi:hypothetical protein